MNAAPRGFHSYLAYYVHTSDDFPAPRTAGKNYPPEIQRALGRAHMLYVEGNVVEASQELSQVVVQCSSVSSAAPGAFIGGMWIPTAAIRCYCHTPQEVS